MPYGYNQGAWDQAKEEAKAIIAQLASDGRVIAYSELSAQISSISFEPHTKPYFNFLGEISEEEDAEGRGLMTALVVHRNGDFKPGPGFFDLAQQRGRDVTDLDRCWAQEVAAVHAAGQ